MSFDFSVKFKGIDNVSKKIDAINKKMGTMSDKAGKVSSRIKSKLGTGFTAQFKLRTKEALSKLRKVKQKIDEIGKKGKDLAKEGIAQVAAGAGFLATVIFPIKKAIEFETAFTQVSKVMSEPEHVISKFRTELLDLTKILPKTAEELAMIAEAGAKLGNKAAVLGKFTEVAVKMSEAMGISTESVGQNMGKIGALLKLGIDDFEILADRLNFIADNTAASGANVLNIIKRVAGSFGALDFSKADIVGISAVADMLSTSPEVAGSGLNRIFTQLRQVAEYKNILEEDKGQGFFKIMQHVGNMTKDQQFQWIQDVIGKGGEAAQLVQKIVNNVDLLNDTLELARSDKALGSLQREFDNVSKTTANKLRLLRNAFDRFSIGVGTALLPLTKQITVFATKILNIFDKFTKENPETISGFVKIAAAIGAMLVVVGLAKIAIGGLGMAFGVLVGAVKIARMAFIAFRATLLFVSMISGLTMGLRMLKNAIMATTIVQKILNIVMTLNPIGLIIAGIAALSTAIFLLYTYWGDITKWVSGLWDAFKINPLQSIIDLFDVLFGKFEWYQSVKDSIGGAWRSVKSLWGDSADTTTQNTIDNTVKNHSVIDVNVTATGGAKAEAESKSTGGLNLRTVENGIS